VSTTTENARLRVVTDNVRLPNIQKAIPKGEYDGHFDWLHAPECEAFITSVLIEIKQDVLTVLGTPNGIPAMQREVLRYLQSGDIKHVE
jgi:hypothetical protein